MKLYRSRQLVEAVQVTMENRNEVAAWCGVGASAGIAMAGYVVDGTEEQIAIVWFPQDPPGIYVMGHDEKLTAVQGTWVVRDEHGFMSAVPDPEFRAKWERAGA
jgi:hypothetical protein